MADFNINDPSTYSQSGPSFTGSYYYTVAVTPSDPSQYTGPPYFTVSSDTLLTEEQILDKASGYARSRRGRSYTDMELDFEIVGATINSKLT